jgi:hypothetical protein
LGFRSHRKAAAPLRIGDPLPRSFAPTPSRTPGVGSGISPQTVADAQRRGRGETNDSDWRSIKLETAEPKLDVEPMLEYIKTIASLIKPSTELIANLKARHDEKDKRRLCPSSPPYVHTDERVYYYRRADNRSSQKISLETRQKVILK